MRDKIKVVVHRHFQALLNNRNTFGHALIVGPSGSGKTYTIKNEIKKLIEAYEIRVPLIEVDATYLTREGWDGYSLSNVIANQNLEPDEIGRAIIYIDEIDKVNMHADDQGHSKGIQHMLLNWMADDGVMLSGMSRSSKLKQISTKQITFIFSGAFQSAWERELSSMGFTGSQTNEVADRLTHDAIIDYGFAKEFVYRIPYLISLSPYTKKELANIVKKHEHIETAKKYFQIDFDDKELIDFIDKHNAGARAINIFLADKDLESSNIIPAPQGQIKTINELSKEDLAALVEAMRPSEAPRSKKCASNHKLQNL